MFWVLRCSRLGEPGILRRTPIVNRRCTLWLAGTLHEVAWGEPSSPSLELSQEEYSPTEPADQRDPCKSPAQHNARQRTAREKDGTRHPPDNCPMADAMATTQSAASFCRSARITALLLAACIILNRAEERRAGGGQDVSLKRRTTWHLWVVAALVPGPRMRKIDSLVCIMKLWNVHQPKSSWQNTYLVCHLEYARLDLLDTT